MPAPTDAGLGSVVEACGTGWSALCAMEVPALALGEIAAMIAGYDEVKHARERAFDLKLWFVATGSNERRIRCVLYDIRYRTQLQVIALPLGERARSIRTSSRKQRGSRRRTADRGFRRRVAGVAAVLILLQNRARAAGVKSEVWVLVVIATGGVGLVAMLARTVQLERRAAG